jgi:Tfp pilus assembly protein PilN
MMIRLNLLDESERPKTTQEIGVKPTKLTLGSSKIQKGIIWGSVGVAVVYVAFLGYYFIGVRAPLEKYRARNAENKKTLAQLKPRVQEANEAKKELEEIQKTVEQYDNFVLSKKRWAHILNVLSNELPEEILFERMTISDGNYTMKTKTDSGLVSVDKKCKILKIDIEVPEDHQGKISNYIKRLEKHRWLRERTFDVENTGMFLRKKKYTTSIQIYVKKFPGEEEEDQT